MGAIPQQPSTFEMPLPEPAPEWRLVDSRSRLVRTLRGVELIVKSSEHHCDGNFQLTIKSTIESSISSEELKRRHQAAWWRTRQLLPVVGVDFPTLETASFNLLDTLDAARKWTERSSIIASNTTVDDIYLSRSRSNQESLTMTLVVDPVRGSRGCVLSMSHTLISTNIYRILQEYIFQLANPHSALGLAGTFKPENAKDITSRLPISLSHAYNLTHAPTPSDLQTAFTAHQKSQERWSRNSIGIPLHPEYKSRPSRIHNKTIAFESWETAAAFKFLKQAGMSLTAAFTACMTSAIAHMYPVQNSNPDGAHLLFSASGRRYLDTAARTGTGQGEVSMPIIPASTWVGSEEVDLRPTSQKALLRLAAAIERAQNADLENPHIIAVFDQIAPDLVKALSDASSLPSGPPPPPSMGRPTLTSQGQFSNKLDRLASQDPGAQVRMTDFNSGGRTTDPSVCFALNSFRDELRFNMLFDEKFFPQGDVALLGQVVARLFRRVTGVDEVGLGVGVVGVRARL
ncbi:hypothetical protein BDV19DRAFT_402210 [Aspergillus venezuelensis]